MSGAMSTSSVVPSAPNGNGGAVAKPLKTSPKSPTTTKCNGPMKATIPMSSVLKQSSPLRSSVSPTFSSWKPNDVHAGLRSPGSTINKVKLRANKSTTLDCIRRSASLDAIYLLGQWPRENLYVPQLLQVDKATQTDEHDWMDTRKVLLIGDADSNGNDKLEKYIRHKLQRSNNPPASSSRSLASPTGVGSVPIVGDHTLNTSSQTNTSCLIPQALPVNIPMKPLSKPTLRNSVEGLNQEIERLVLKLDELSHFTCDKTDDYDKATLEGHRAPFPDLYRNTRSVNTQTPLVNDLRGSCHSSSGSHGSSPDLEYSCAKMGTSPRIFLARGPPDGCERVNLRTESKLTPKMMMQSADHGGIASPPQQPCTAFKLQPSQGSAFQLLQPIVTSAEQNVSPIPIIEHELV